MRRKGYAMTYGGFLFVAVVVAGAGGFFFGSLTPRGGGGHITPTREILDARAPCADCALLRTEYDALRAQLTATASTVETVVEEPPSETFVVEEQAMTTLMSQETEAQLREEQRAAIERQKKSHDERMTFLQDVDLSLLSAAEQRIHADYLQLVAEVQALREQVNASVTMGEPVPQDLAEELFEKQMQLQQLRDAEYSTLVSAVGISMGLSREESIAFTQLIREIYAHLEMGGPRISISITEPPEE